MREEMTLDAGSQFLKFMQRTNPFGPLEAIEPSEPLSHEIKGQHAPRAPP